LGIGSDVAHYRLPTALPTPHERAVELAAIPTRLKRLSPEQAGAAHQRGYAICDTAIRRHFPQPDMPAPTFPYAIGV
jgi:NTE family protein